MAEIKTKKGEVILVDDEDFEWLNQFEWRLNDRGYAIRAYNDKANGKNFVVRMHRAILGISNSSIHADHKNGDRADNRRENLRTCTIAENARNRSMHDGKRFGLKGVYKSARGGYWSSIMHNGKRRHLGTFETPELAAEFYQLASDMLHGEFSRQQYVAKQEHRY